MKTMKNYSIREFTQVLKNNGYYFCRQGKGSHKIYTNGHQTISLPGSRLTRNVIFKLIKQYHLEL